MTAYTPKQKFRKYIRTILNSLEHVDYLEEIQEFLNNEKPTLSKKDFKRISELNISF